MSIYKSLEDVPSPNRRTSAPNSKPPSISNLKTFIYKNPLRSNNKNNAVLVIHGGAGTMTRADSTPEMEMRYKAVLEEALIAGFEVLEKGGEAMDAAVAAVVVLENCPLFNAAKGAVFNIDGKIELESSIMLSKPPSTHTSIPPSRRGIGLTLLTHARNPSRCARALYLAPEKAPHTMFSGLAAEAIAEGLGEEMVDPGYFFTEERWREHERESGDAKVDRLPTGTVGAVALDSRGCIACVTSTGGRTNKLVGRIGDTPQMSSGYWAEEWRVRGWWRRMWGRKDVKGVGISGTGDGDYFIRYDTAGTLGHRMKLLNESVGDAAREVVDELRDNGGMGGVISLDREGNYALCLNTSGMYRGVIGKDGVPRTAIYSDEDI